MKQNMVKTTKNYQATNAIQNVRLSNLKPMTTNTGTIDETATDVMFHETVQTFSSTTEDCFITQTCDRSSINIKKYDENILENNFTDKTIKSESAHNISKTILNADTVTVNINTSSMSSLFSDKKSKTYDVLDTKIKVEHCSTAECHTVESNINHTLTNSKNQATSDSSQSNATTGVGSDIDDLLNIIETNYSYIMDTKLLDICHQTKSEIENKTIVQSVDFCSSQPDKINRNKSLFKDARDLYNWLCEMEQKLSNAPTSSRAANFSSAKLQQQKEEYTLLYQELISHSQGIRRCLRAAYEREERQEYSKEQKGQQLQQSQLFNNNSNSVAVQNNLYFSSTGEILKHTVPTANPTIKSSSVRTKVTNSSSLRTNVNVDSKSESPSGDLGAGAKKYKGNLERLENRYYLLCLKALEAQVYLDVLISNESWRNIIPSGNSDIGNEEDDYSLKAYADSNNAAKEKYVSELERNNAVRKNNDSLSFSGLVRYSNDKKRLSTTTKSPARAIQIHKCLGITLNKFADLSSDNCESGSYTTAPAAVPAARLTIPVDNDLGCLDFTTSNITLNSFIFQGGFRYFGVLTSSLIKTATAVPVRIYDCEASDEPSETDSPPQSVFDFSKSPTSSTVTIMQTNPKPYGNYTVHTSNTFKNGCDNNNRILNIVKTVEKFQNLSDWKSNCPYSLSCLSQLTTATEIAKNVNNSKDLYNDLITVSALNSLSSEGPYVRSTFTESSKSPIKRYYNERFFKHGNTRKNEFSNSFTDSLILTTKKLDSLSPPRTDSFQQNKVNIIKRDAIASSVNQTRHRRKLRLAWKRRLNLPKVSKLYQEFLDNKSGNSFTLLSSTFNASRDNKDFGCQKQRTVSKNRLDLNHMLHMMQFTILISSLSNLDITDCGKIFDGHLLEHKQRLTALRRLAIKLESLSAHGSNAVLRVARCMKSAEADMKNLQNTYRDLIVRVGIAHQNMKQRPIKIPQQKNLTNGEQKAQQYSNSICKNKHDQCLPTSKQIAANRRIRAHKKSTEQTSSSSDQPDSESIVDDDVDVFDDENNKAPKCNWIYRMVLVQLVLIVIVICIVSLIQPTCCDNFNNLSNSFQPHLRYIRGPPPV